MPTRQGWSALFGGIASLVVGRLFGLIELYVVGSALVAAFTLGWGRFCRRRYGGVTGDLLGACCELAETLVLVLCVAIAT